MSAPSSKLYAPCSMLRAPCFGADKLERAAGFGVLRQDRTPSRTYFTFDSRAEQQTEVYLRYGQHPELYPNRRGEVVQGSYCEREYRDCRLQTCYVQSPAYPGLYPRALNCRYKLHTRQPYIKLYLQNEQFAVDGQR
ncbi:GD25153 [Drosophila simulans]|uniref:GD25153 n=1 Tax=Drosophila simulans TaxID=7240 RepID=B4QH09_DROSI|nr:GD25153 [Drosophila simulans]